VVTCPLMSSRSMSCCIDSLDERVMVMVMVMLS
jgi:hypothetical protein